MDITMWIETDLEPDDLLALAILPKAKYYVVSEGNANIKYNRMKRYCQLLKNEDAIVIEGFSTEREYSLDGKEFSDLPTEQCDNNYLNHFIKFANSTNPIMFSLKPMGELMNEYVKNPLLIESLVGKIELYTYGGFNFRCILKYYEKPLLDLLKRFKKVVIYESFLAHGDNNSVNKFNCPNLYRYIINHCQEPFYDALLKATKNWNQHLCDKFKNGDQRQLDVLKKIEDHLDFQYVLADFGLAAVYDRLKPTPVKNLRFTNTFTTFDYSDTPTKLYVYKDVLVQTVETLLLRKLGDNVV